jgi:hypothetical protein
MEARRFIADVKAAARELTPDAMDTLKQVMKDPKAPPAARVGAATAVLDRGWGRAMQPVEAQVSFLDKMGDSEKTELLAALDLLKAEEDEDKSGLPN